MRKFLADAMLKKLAEWLRILGIYCEYDFVVGKPDSEIMDYAKKNRLILLTRDAKMVPSLEKRNVDYLLIGSMDTSEQLAQVLRAYGYRIGFPEYTRCPSCNGEFRIVRSVDRSQVPPNVYARKRKFWICKSCGKIYWKGGHWKNMYKTIRKVRALIS